jgi:hypothetical protein
VDRHRQTDRRKGMTKQIVAFRNVGNVLKNQHTYQVTGILLNQVTHYQAGKRSYVVSREMSTGQRTQHGVSSLLRLELTAGK